MRRLILLAALVLLVSACAHPSVAQLQTNPAKYFNKTVTVSGVVTSSWNIPLVPFHFYRVNDGTGDLTVMSNRPLVPPKGARVSVKGKVNDVAMLGGRALGLHLVEEHLNVK